MGGLRTFLFSFQTKLVLALTAVILLSIFLAGTVFVVRERDDRRNQALNRVAAASPAIYQQAIFAVLPGVEEDDEPFEDTLKELAREQDVRIIMVAPDGTVLVDSDERLAGAHIEIPRSDVEDIQRGFVAWAPGGDFPEKNVTFVSASQRFVTNGGRELPFRIVLAVRTDTIAEAWRGVLPGLLLAAGVAIPLAALAAIVLARQVAQPVRKLTAASAAMALGDFDQRVEVDRDDEIGRLARSFTTMAQRVGERDTQMRELLANVSHDLKTPMTSITGYAQSLNDGTAAPEDAARIGGIIGDEAQHVNALLADLLYLGEIDAGQVVTRREDVPLESVLSRCLRRIEPAAQSKGVTLSVDVDPGVTLHNVDGEKVERAMTNVLENAVKFSPSEGRVSVQGWAENGLRPPRAHLAVSNAGAGIAEGDLPHVFDRFFRGDRARRTSSGSGLGLAITRELVELNGGDIEARSDAAGVTFEITLPASPVAPSAP